MLDKEKMEESLKRDLDSCKDYLSRVKPIVELVPAVEKRLKEDEAKLVYFEKMPEDIIEEQLPNQLSIQIEDEKRWRDNLPILPVITDEMKITVMAHSTSGSSSDYLTNAETAHMTFQYHDDAGVLEVKNVFSQLAKDREQQDNIDKKLAQLHSELSTMFQDAQKSFVQSQYGTTGIDQAAKRLRDVIQRTWGELADRARGRKSADSLALRRERDRTYVANNLTTDDHKRKKLIVLFGNMAKLSSDLSQTGFMKSSLSNDYPKLESFHDRWILLLFDLTTLLELR